MAIGTSTSFSLFASKDPFVDSTMFLSTGIAIRTDLTGPNNGSADGSGFFSISPVTTAVPEPTSMALLASGLAGVLLRRRRKA